MTSMPMPLVWLGKSWTPGISSGRRSLRPPRRTARTWSFSSGITARKTKEQLNCAVCIVDLSGQEVHIGLDFIGDWQAWLSEQDQVGLDFVPDVLEANHPYLTF